VRIQASDLWRWDGGVDRATFASIGITLSIVKYGIDFFLVHLLCGRSWMPLNYWMAGDTFGALLYNDALAPARWSLLITSIPFIWAGVALTLRRLRSADLSPWLVAVFFMPGLNFLLFVILTILPAKDVPRRGVWPKDTVLGRWIPESGFWSAAASLVITTVPIGALILMGSTVLKQYGWGLFIGAPFLIGFFSTVLYEYHAPRSLLQSIGVTLMALGLLAGAILLFAIEGAICIVMAAPIAIGIAFVGTIVGHAMSLSGAGSRSRTLLGLLLTLTFLMGAEKVEDPEAPLQAIRTSVVIDAPPERVWRHVVSFTEIPPPAEALFRTGLSYPLRAEIRGRGVGAVRHCVFTTGPFVEPITTWDEPRLLAFGVTQQPAPMEEWTPYRGIHPPHLDGYFVSRRGQFLLEPLPGGRTRLEGTTWYTHRLFPTVYWGLWSDVVIHRIHGRVLRHVKQLAEEKGA
jgi:Polyketide cyclase / dehydrase and lipid transport